MADAAKREEMLARLTAALTEIGEIEQELFLAYVPGRPVDQCPHAALMAVHDAGHVHADGLRKAISLF